MQRLNAFGQKIGDDVPGWTSRPLPARIEMKGRFCRLVPLDAKLHARDLFDADSLAPDGRGWTYLAPEPITTFADYEKWCAEAAAAKDRLYFAVIDPKTGKAVGRASYMRIDPANGALEIGDIKFSPLLQRKPAATETIYLLLRYPFEELGYRRHEWKCDNCNEPSKAAAERFGYTFEGIFRQALVYKGRNRDTAWYSIVDKEWPAIKKGFERWLSPENFDATGQQKTPLADLIATARA